MPTTFSGSSGAPAATAASVAPTIAIVDDDQAICDLMAHAVELMGHGAVAFPSAEAALDHLRRTGPVALLFTDLDMPGMDGLGLLNCVKDEFPETDVVLMTGHATVASAVSAMKKGALDYLTKPFDLIEIERIVGRRAELGRLRNENAALRRELGLSYRAEGAETRIVASSERMRRVFDVVRAVRANRSTVLILGESGTGKELVARAIHYGGPFADSPFVSVNCGSIPRSLVESQLFGHRRGSFTGAIADHPGYFRAAEGGTLFLDEIGEVDLEVQVRLLRAIEAHEVTPVGGAQPIKVAVRIVAATNRDLKQAVDDGAFRRDLYYRLDVVSIELPPLRERPEDIPALVEHFNRRFAREYGIERKEVPPETLAVLTRHDWPGNVRELENVIERAFALGGRGAILPQDLPAALAKGQRAGDGGGAPAAPAFPALPAGAPFPSLEEMEREHVRAALLRAAGNKTKAADLLGVDRQTLYRKIARYGL